MKNLMIVAALALGTMTAVAQDDTTTMDDAGTAVEETATDANDAATDAAGDTYSAAQEGAESTGEAVEGAAEETGDAMDNAVESTGDAVETAADDTADYAEDKTGDAKEAMSQDGFNEVATEEVPEAITTALEEAHPGATVDKASMNDESQYKLEVTKEDGETAELYMDAEGNMIDM